jgi:hypothetical protein
LAGLWECNLREEFHQQQQKLLNELHHCKGEVRDLSGKLRKTRIIAKHIIVATKCSTGSF